MFCKHIKAWKDWKRFLDSGGNKQGLIVDIF